MNNEAQSLDVSIAYHSPSLIHAEIRIPAPMVSLAYQQAVASQRTAVHATGFPRGATPLEYIEQHLRPVITEHLKEFLLNFCVMGDLYDYLRTHKVVFTGFPRLSQVHVSPPETAVFTFELSRAPELDLIDWHYLPFKSPKRKNYKDLDRQVELFLKEEKENLKNTTDTSLTIGDWVNFSIHLVNPLNPSDHTFGAKKFWLKLGDEEVDAPLRSLFIGRKAGDRFTCADVVLQEYFSTQLNSNYLFEITILDVVKDSYFCLEHFKKHFKLKTNKDLQSKLIEVFSYRNDISLRRNIAEESLKLLLHKHKFDIPEHIILRQQQNLLETISSNPDYHVYRAQKEFQRQVRQLAEKQARELILIDTLGHQEELPIADEDIPGYINLMQRPRAKEFIYFETPVTKHAGQELPLASALLKHYALREKTLNHVIHHLTKQ